MNQLQEILMGAVSTVVLAYFALREDGREHEHTKSQPPGLCRGEHLPLDFDE
jgi:hypothetical protein